MSPHTPGPWREDEDAIEVVLSENDDQIASVWRSDVGEDQQNANRRLIAAAPELLEAVKRAQRLADDLGDTSKGMWAWASDLEDLIAKAEGAS